jgi:HAD superfamily hydrolase (TIGR01509 family)
MGKPHEAVRSAFVAQAGIAPDLEKYSRLYQEAYRHLLRDRLAVVPGAIELCQELSERGFLLGVVTSSRSWMTDYVLSKTGLDHFFDVQVSAEDVQTPKPAPDAYMLALQRLGVRPATAVAFEDSETGVEAAAKAGITVLAVRHDWNQGHDLSKAVAEFASFRNTALVVGTVESILVPAQV